MIPGAGKKAAEKLFKDKEYLGYELAVVSAYLNKYGTDGGMPEFLKNHGLLYILDDFDGFEVTFNTIERKEIDGDSGTSNTKEEDLW